MGHVIEFGHSVVLEWMCPASHPLRWWFVGDVGVYEPYRVAVEGQAEDSVAKDGKRGGQDYRS